MQLHRALPFWLASALCGDDPARGLHAEVVDCDRIVIIDGDTVALPCLVPAKGCAEKIRFVDIDAPETFRPHCENERRVGLEAKERVPRCCAARPSMSSAPAATIAPGGRLLI